MVKNYLPNIPITIPGSNALKYLGSAIPGQPADSKPSNQGALFE